MKVVIDISEESYNRILNDNWNIALAGFMCCAIANGMPLPKGHGRLIDADALKAEFQEHHDFYIDAYCGFSNMSINDKLRVDEITGSIASVVNAPTIIPADEEDEE